MRFRRAKPGRSDAPATVTLYYASDVHGSDRCWRKFLGAASFYRADRLIMGGDLTGKAIVPIERIDGSFQARLLGEQRTATAGKQLDELLEAIRFNGMYPWQVSREDIARYTDDARAQEALFDEVIQSELRRWIELADNRSQQLGFEVFVMPGNDDPWSCDPVIAGARRVRACDDRVVRVGPHEMISCAYSNRTPWNSPRELDENDLYRRLRGLVDQLEDPGNAIFNLHVPPYDSGLDRAAEIREDLTVVYIGGQPHMIPVGSRAVRQIIEEAQPLVSLHGHIHESRGVVRIGRTLAINSGSEYNSGRIHGVVVKLATGHVRSHQFVAG